VPSTSPPWSSATSVPRWRATCWPASLRCLDRRVSDPRAADWAPSSTRAMAQDRRARPEASSLPAGHEAAGSACWPRLQIRAADDGVDHSEANLRLRLPVRAAVLRSPRKMLDDLGVRSSPAGSPNNPAKVDALVAHGFGVTRPYRCPRWTTPHNLRYSQQARTAWATSSNTLETGRGRRLRSPGPPPCPPPPAKADHPERVRCSRSARPPRPCPTPQRYQPSTFDVHDSGTRKAGTPAGRPITRLAGEPMTAREKESA